MNGRADETWATGGACDSNDICSPTWDLGGMEPTGIEPVTSCLQSRRSPS